jgi:organic radical activating enzyme
MGGLQGWPTYQQAASLIDAIVDHSMHAYRTYNLLGGEPTLWKHFGDLCAHIKATDTDSIIQVLTNGSRTIRWWKKYAMVMDKVVISHHCKTALKEHTCDVVSECQAYNSVSVQVLMDITNFDQCVEHFDYMIAHLPGVKISPKKGETELGSNTWMGYSDAQLLWMDHALQRSKANDKLPPNQERVGSKASYTRVFYASDDHSEWETSNKDLILQQKNHFEGWKCNIGIDMLCVKPNGDLKPSSSCFKQMILGNYKLDAAINWPTSPMVCVYAGCYCGADIEVEKHAPK